MAHADPLRQRGCLFAGNRPQQVMVGLRCVRTEVPLPRILVCLFADAQRKHRSHAVSPTVRIMPRFAVRMPFFSAARGMR